MTAERRWVTEAAVLTELENLNDASARAVQEYADRATRAATAEAEHKAARAKTILRVLAAEREPGSPRPSHALAETTAEADDTVSAAYLERLTTAAVADATRERLRSIRECQNSLRTAAASVRSMFTGPGQ